MKTVVSFGSRYTDTTPCFRDRLCLSVEAGGLRTNCSLRFLLQTWDLYHGWDLDENLGLGQY